MIMEPVLPLAVQRSDHQDRHRHVCPAGRRASGVVFTDLRLSAFLRSHHRMSEWQKFTHCLSFSKSTGLLQPGEDLVLVGARQTHIMAARHRERLSERCHDVIGTSGLPRFPRAYAGGSANVPALVMHALHMPREEL